MNHFMVAWLHFSFLIPCILYWTGQSQWVCFFFSHIADDERCWTAPAARPSDRPPVDPAEHVLLARQTQGPRAPHAHHEGPRRRQRAGPGVRRGLRRSVATDKGRGRDQGRYAGDAPSEAGVLRVCEAREEQGASLSGAETCWPTISSMSHDNPVMSFSTIQTIQIL